MAETPSSPPELPPVPYERLAAYADTLRGLVPTCELVALWCGEKRLRTGEDVATIEHAAPLEVIPGRFVSGAELSGIAQNLQRHLNLATTGEEEGVEDAGAFFYLAGRYTVATFNEAFPAFALEPSSDRRLNHVDVVHLFRKEKDMERDELVVAFRPEGHATRWRGRTSYSRFSVHFFDQRPAIAQFVATYALLGFPAPPLTHQV